MGREALETGDQRRALDHYIVQVHDLDEAGGAYERLGFTVLPRMTHGAVGTSNRVIQLANTYLEILGDLEKAPPELMQEYLPRFECGEGLVHISVRTSDLEADHEEAQSLGLDPRPLLNARRKVDMPDGSVEETDSHCFYMWRPDRLYLSIFLTAHYKPDTIWIPEYQQHANTAIDTIGISFVSDDPGKDIDYFSKVYRCGPASESADEVLFRGARGDVAEILSKERMRERFAPLDLEICDKQPGYPVAASFSVGSLSQCMDALEANGVTYVRMGDAVLVGPEETHGVVIEFVEEDA